MALLRYTRRMNAVALPGAVAAIETAGWRARLELGFERRGARTALSHRAHTGPLRVQKALYPEGPALCQTIVVHPPGGIVGGDRLEVDVDVGAQANAQVTTPGAAKWYRSTADTAFMSARLAVGAEASLEWLPQETLIFDGARADIVTRIDLARGARFIGWEIVGLGRTASGERFSKGRLRQSVELCEDGRLAWCERAVLDGGSAALQSGAILGGAPVFGTMVAAGMTIDDDVLAACRSVSCSRGAAAVTRLPHLLIARYCGGSTAEARMHLARIWHVLRPAMLGRAAVMPRIWST